MSTAAARRGHDRFAVAFKERAACNTYSWWKRVTFPGGSEETNLSVWVRFSELNRLASYYHVNCLNRRIWASQHEWRQQELKRTYRSILERLATCDRPRLP